MTHILKLAYPYKDKLQKAYYKILLNDKYKYYNFDTFWNYEINIEDSNWNFLQQVSVNKNDNVSEEFIDPYDDEEIVYRKCKDCGKILI